MTTPARVMAAAVALLALGGCRADEVAEPAPPTSTAPPHPSAAGERLDLAVLRWLLSPTGTCPPPQVIPLVPSDDPTFAFLEVLGLTPATTTVPCPPTQDTAR